MPQDIHPHYHVTDKSQVQCCLKETKQYWKIDLINLWGKYKYPQYKKQMNAGHNPLLILFSLFRNGTGNDASTSPLEIGLAIKGLLILRTAATTASMNLIWFTHHQAPHRLETTTSFLYFNQDGNYSTFHTIDVSSLCIQSTVNSNYKGRSWGHLAHWNAKGKLGKCFLLNNISVWCSVENNLMDGSVAEACLIHVINI